MNKKLLVTTLLCASISLTADELNQLNNQSVNGAGPLVATVANSGADMGDCTFSGAGTIIQDAIDDLALYDEIRIVNGTYPENLTIDDRSITIKGGYATCAAASSDTSVFDNQSINTVIQPIAPTSSPVISITGNDASRDEVSFSNIFITGGVNDGFLTSGGISTLSDDLQLDLTHVWIDSNVGILGGGLAIVGGDTDVFARNLMIHNNSAEQGGGIYCTGADTSVIIDYNNPSTDTFGIIQNFATNGSGGGVFASSGCQFNYYAGSPNPTFVPPFDLRGIHLNSATEHGGGIAVEAGAAARLTGYQFCFFGCNGDNENPAAMLANQADSDDDNSGKGGAIYATGTDSTVNVYNSWIAGNTAYQGAAFAVEDTAEVTTDSQFIDFLFGEAIPCWSTGSCNRIELNIAENTGGAFDVRSGATANVLRSQITGNRADVGVVFYSNAGSINLESSLIVQNGDGGADGFNDNWLMRIFGGATANITFTTIADNDVGSQILVNDSSSITVGTSIIHQSDATPVYSNNMPVSESFDCMMVHEVGSIPGGAFIVADDPEFVDRLNGDYHLNEAISPAVDFCDALQNQPTTTDIENDSRPWDWSNISNDLGPYDLGSDETSDLIFEDDFDGNTIPI